jgi:hypothetical protein
MNAYELMRKVTVGPLTVRLWVAADAGLCEECEERADEVALCAAALADEDDIPIVLADKLKNILRGLAAVEVCDESGNGVLVRDDAFTARRHYE